MTFRQPFGTTYLSGRRDAEAGIRAEPGKVVVAMIVPLWITAGLIVLGYAAKVAIEARRERRRESLYEAWTMMAGTLPTGSWLTGTEPDGLTVVQIGQRQHMEKTRVRRGQR